MSIAMYRWVSRGIDGYCEASIGIMKYELVSKVAQRYK